MSVAWSRQWNAAVLLPVSVWFCCCRHCVCISSLISIVHSLKRFVQKCWQQSITDFIKEIHFYSHLSCLLLQFYIAFSHTHARTHTHTHTHPFNGFFSGTTQVSRYQKGKTNLDFSEARDSEWQWHQLECMQVCTSLQTDNHASTPPLSFLQVGCPSCRPTNSVKALKAFIAFSLR